VVLDFVIEVNSLGEAVAHSERMVVSLKSDSEYFIQKESAEETICCCAFASLLIQFEDGK
jgi:hypothetical protein